MSELQIFERAQHNEVLKVDSSKSNKYMGFFYILEYGEELIKIGSTKNPYKRLKDLVRSAEVYGKTKIGRFAISKEHTNYVENEFFLHKYFKKFRISSCELFNISFSEALRIFPCSIIYKDESLHLSEKSEKLLKSLKQNFALETIPVIPDYNELADLITITRQIMIEEGRSYKEIGQMVQSIFDACNIPVNLFDFSSLEGTEL